MSAATPVRRRRALLLACATFDDPAFPPLRSPAHDVEALTAVLADGIGPGYEVESVVNCTSQDAELAIERFFRHARPTDVNLLYFSCHGVQSPQGDLYFAFTDTQPDFLGSTAVSAAWVRDRLRSSRSRASTVLIDCCFSGAFLRGMQAKSHTSVNVENLVRDLPEGNGVAVITASGETEFSMEEAEARADAAIRPSYFTEAIIDGIATGAADQVGDGSITVDELYGYVYDRVVEGPSPQRPRMMRSGEGTIVVAQRPATGWLKGHAPTAAPPAPTTPPPSPRTTSSLTLPTGAWPAPPIPSRLPLTSAPSGPTPPSATPVSIPPSAAPARPSASSPAGPPPTDAGPPRARFRRPGRKAAAALVAAGVLVAAGLAVPLASALLGEAAPDPAAADTAAPGGPIGDGASEAAGGGQGESEPTGSGTAGILSGRRMFAIRLSLSADQRVMVDSSGRLNTTTGDAGIDQFVLTPLDNGYQLQAIRLGPDGQAYCMGTRKVAGEPVTVVATECDIHRPGQIFGVEVVPNKPIDGRPAYVIRNQEGYLQARDEGLVVEQIEPGVEAPTPYNFVDRGPV